MKRFVWILSLVSRCVAVLCTYLFFIETAEIHRCSYIELFNIRTIKFQMYVGQAVKLFFEGFLIILRIFIAMSWYTNWNFIITRSSSRTYLNCFWKICIGKCRVLNFFHNAANKIKQNIWATPIKVYELRIVIKDFEALAAFSFFPILTRPSPITYRT